MTTSSPSSGAARTALTATEARVADAFFERLFPADEHGPGARAIGVLDYVDRALAGHDSRLVPSIRPSSRPSTPRPAAPSATASPSCEATNRTRSCST